MRPEGLQGVVLAVAQERRSDVVLERITAVVAAQAGVALARVWLIEPGDICERCHMRAECPDRARCLHLVASAGHPRDGGQTWNGLDGGFRRFPLGARKVGKVGATGSGILLHDMSERSTWIVRPQWAAREGIRSFAAQPLVFRGEVLGVLAAFSRTRIDAEAFGWLRAFADHAAVAIANARAFEEVDRLRAQLEVENRCLREDAVRALGGGDIVGSSPALAKALEQVDLVAPTGASVLVLGESGTGKELVARRVHAGSRRADRPFVTVNCAAVPRELFESEFFGHARGAFTGAVHDRVGRFEVADGGTLFLDEIGEVPLDLQGKLLRVLQDGTFERVGETRTRRVDVRIVAATNRDLDAEVPARRFREDLYFRLSVFPIRVPPLRDRPGDVAPLVEHFLGIACARLGRPRLVATARDLRVLERHPWPGNVRELASAVERAVVLAHDGRLRFELGETGRGHGAVPDREPIPVAEWRHRERANVEAALARAGGRIYGRGGAAELLGVPPTTLASRVKALGIPRGAIRLSRDLRGSAPP
jgi:transcriptional regulator with GAF, ATPase, and Fis domain